MGKYIDSEKLIAEIERQQRRLVILSNTEQVGIRRDCALQNGVYTYILGLITSLQQEQPEVDIEKEIEEHAQNMPHGEFTHESECVEHEEWAKREFHHFYGFGLNATKEE